MLVIISYSKTSKTDTLFKYERSSVKINREPKLRSYRYSLLFGGCSSFGFNSSLAGTRSCGRPKKRWLEVVKEDMTVNSLTINDAQDCAMWRTLSRKADIGFALYKEVAVAFFCGNLAYQIYQCPGTWQINSIIPGPALGKAEFITHCHEDIAPSCLRQEHKNLVTGIARSYGLHGKKRE